MQNGKDVILVTKRNKGEYTRRKRAKGKKESHRAEAPKWLNTVGISVLEEKELTIKIAI